MSTAYAVNEILFGSQKCYFTRSSVEKFLGHISEDDPVRLSVEPSWREIKVDLYGEVPVNRIFRGIICTVGFVARQWDDEQLLAAIPTALQTAGPTIKAITWGDVAGQSGIAAAYGGQLRLHNAEVADATTTGDVYLYLCNQIGRFESEFSTKAPRQVGYLFGALIDTSRTAGDLIGRWKTQTT